jgi:hypothetical protein
MSTGLLETEMIITHNPPLNFGELYIISTLLTYGLSILRSYDWARKYKQGRCENHIEEEFGEFVSENPRRALYPVKFVEELLVPSALYWFQKISENNIIVPISTPTVR